MTIKSKYFCGNEVSEYGQNYGYVDYRTLAKAFDAVLNNDIMSITRDYGIGSWEQVSGLVDNSEEIEEKEEAINELEEKIQERVDELEAGGVNATEVCDGLLEELQTERDGLQEEIDNLRYQQDWPPEIYQYYIVSDSGADILKDAGEVLFYNEALDIYLWGVTHYGTSWDYVLTNIRIEKDDE